MIKQNPASSLRELFLAAAEIDNPQARAAYLDQCCADDQPLRRRVEALLAAEAEAGPSPELAQPLPPPPVALTDPPLGSRIGHYKLLQQIGEGGCGVVFMAEQEEPVRRKVALKVIKLGMDTKQVVARFGAERQALALMDHPNIAQVFDAGATESGRPYFVMELVRGTKITDYCDQHRFSIRQRLDLFIQVCHAVQHAHQKGIIHRDLKPSNILVTELDGVPLPKIIDFGIAKAVEGRLTDQTLFTAFEQFIGTPAYMSPEQAAMSAADIDTRSDIYSLGVLLYELLTGKTPFDTKVLLAAGLGEMRRTIQEVKPVRPSTQLRQTSATSSPASSRFTRPSPLATDLDWIAMKCLEKDRKRRYETANGLALDLQRHLDNEPVLARPPSRLYEFQKSVRRHKIGFAATTVVIVVLVAGVLASWWEATRARQAQQRATLNFQLARNAVDEITQVADKQLANVPGVDKVRRELLRKALVFYDGFAAGNKNDPAARAEIAQAYMRVGEIHNELGDFTQDREAYGRAIALLEELTAAFPSVPEYRVELADCWGEYAYSFKWAHGVQEAVQGSIRALNLWEGLVAEFPTEPEYRQRLALAYTHLGTALREAGQLKESETQLRRALAMWKELGADFSERPKDLGGLAHSHWWLGALLLDLGQLTEAGHELRVALDLNEKRLAKNPNDPWLRASVAHNRAYVATVLLKQGNGEAAEQEFRQVIATREKLVAEFPDVFEYRRRLGLELRGLSEALMAHGCPKEAEEVLRQAIAHQEKIATGLPEMCEFQMNLADSLAELGGILSKTGRLEESVAAYRRSIRITERLPADFLEVPHIRKRLARVYLDCGRALEALGRSDAAMQAYEQAKVIEAAVPSP